jgi:hypothetical protein
LDSYVRPARGVQASSCRGKTRKSQTVETRAAAREPNVGFAGNIILVAMREVIAGEELTTDYALFDDYDGQMTCRCNTASCRRVIDGHDWRRRDLQLRYHGYFSWYLEGKITETHADGDTT